MGYIVVDAGDARSDLLGHFECSNGGIVALFCSISRPEITKRPMICAVELGGGFEILDRRIEFPSLKCPHSIFKEVILVHI